MSPRDWEQLGDLLDKARHLPNPECGIDVLDDALDWVAWQLTQEGAA